MIYQDRFDPNLKITFNGDEYTCSRRKVLKLGIGKEWNEINFVEVKSGDTIKLQDPDGSWVYHEDGRNTFVAKSNTKLDELGLLCFEI
jgi:hypothetical protein